MATMREVAERAGVSAKTVSRVLRNDQYVSDNVLQPVNAAVEELQYVLNVLAVSFHTGRDAAKGLARAPARGDALPDSRAPTLSRIVHAVPLGARRAQTAVIVARRGSAPEHQ